MTHEGFRAETAEVAENLGRVGDGARMPVGNCSATCAASARDALAPPRALRANRSSPAGRTIPRRGASEWCGVASRAPQIRAMTDARTALGALGERVAARWLARAGWTILARRFRSGHRDLDLVARRDGVVAFVEVKARRGVGLGDPVEAVHWRKRRELTRSAWVWIDRHGRPGEAYRFDVIGVLFLPSGVRVRHVPDAFQVPVRA